MADAPKKPQETERTIGKTTYIVTSHFKPQGGTAVQLIKQLVDRDTKDVKP